MRAIAMALPISTIFRNSPMHPPFYVVDHKIDPAPDPQSARLLAENRLLRRTRPERLDLARTTGVIARTTTTTTPAPAAADLAATLPRRSLFTRFVGNILRRFAATPALDKS
jgi:hypothetical protein